MRGRLFMAVLVAAGLMLAGNATAQVLYRFNTPDATLSPDDGFDPAVVTITADPNIVGDQQPNRVQPQGHDERHELVGPWHHGESPEGTEGDGAAAETEAGCITQQETAGGVPRQGRVWWLEAGGPYVAPLQGEVYTGHLILSARQGPQPQDALLS